MTFEKILMISIGVLIIALNKSIYNSQVLFGKDIGWELEHSEWWNRTIVIFIGSLILFIGIIK